MDSVGKFRRPVASKGKEEPNIALVALHAFRKSVSAAFMRMEGVLREWKVPLELLVEEVPLEARVVERDRLDLLRVLVDLHAADLLPSAAQEKATRKQYRDSFAVVFWT